MPSTSKDYSPAVKLYSTLWLVSCIRNGETSISPKVLSQEIQAHIRQEVFSRLVIAPTVSVLPTRPCLCPCLCPCLSPCLTAVTVQDLCNKLGELTFYVLAGSWPLVRRHALAEFDYFSPLLRALQGIFGVGKYVDFQLAVAQLRPLQAKTGGLTFDLDAMISGIDERAFSSQ